MTVVRDIPWTFEIDTFLADAAIDPADELAEEARRFAAATAPLLQPKAVYDEVPVDAWSRDASAPSAAGPPAHAPGSATVTVGATVFQSDVLRRNLEAVGRVFPYVVTCGDELEGFDLSAWDYLAFFWVDQIKQTALTQAAGWLHERLVSETGFAHLSSINPGSGNVDVWPIDQQRQLFSLFPGVTELIGVRLTESCLMVPNKSVSGLFFPSEVHYVNCQACTRENCRNRRASYVDEHLCAETGRR